MLTRVVLGSREWLTDTLRQCTLLENNPLCLQPLAWTGVERQEDLLDRNLAIGILPEDAPPVSAKGPLVERRVNSAGVDDAALARKFGHGSSLCGGPISRPKAA